MYANYQRKRLPGQVYFLEICVPELNPMLPMANLCRTFDSTHDVMRSPCALLEYFQRRSPPVDAPQAVMCVDLHRKPSPMRDQAAAAAAIPARTRRAPPTLRPPRRYTWRSILMRWLP